MAAKEGVVKTLEHLVDEWAHMRVTPNKWSVLTEENKRKLFRSLQAYTLGNTRATEEQIEVWAGKVALSLHVKQLKDRGDVGAPIQQLTDRPEGKIISHTDFKPPSPKN